MAWLMRRASSITSAQEAEAAAFEQTLMANARSAEKPETPQSAQGVRMRATTAMPLMSDAPGQNHHAAPASPAEASRVGDPFPPAPAIGAHARGAGTAKIPEFQQAVIEKFRIAGLFEMVEGPLRSANPEIQGTLISIRGGRRLGIMESRLDQKDPAIPMLLRHVDALIIAGPEGEPLLIKRFQDFLSDAISF